jgi:hypothetical protein
VVVSTLRFAVRERPIAADETWDRAQIRANFSRIY